MAVERLIRSVVASGTGRAAGWPVTDSQKRHGDDDRDGYGEVEQETVVPSHGGLGGFYV